MRKCRSGPVTTLLDSHVQSQLILQISNILFLERQIVFCKKVRLFVFEIAFDFRDNVDSLLMSVLIYA